MIIESMVIRNEDSSHWFGGDWGLVAGYLKHRKEDVFLVGRGKSVEAIARDGLHISGTRGNIDVRIDIFHKLEQNADLVILAMKTHDLDRFLKDSLLYLKDTPVLTTQNGIQAEKILANHIRKDNIISSIVMFGSTYEEPNKIIHNFEGKWIIGRPFARNEAGLKGNRSGLKPDLSCGSQPGYPGDEVAEGLCQCQ